MTLTPTPSTSYLPCGSISPVALGRKDQALRHDVGVGWLLKPLAVTISRRPARVLSGPPKCPPCECPSIPVRRAHRDCVHPPWHRRPLAKPRVGFRWSILPKEVRLKPTSKPAQGLHQLESGTTTQAALAFFDSLPPVEIATMIGSWRGKGVETGHPLDGLVELFGWHGKRFTGPDGAHPLV
jgi:hypothetical protein